MVGKEDTVLSDLVIISF